MKVRPFPIAADYAKPFEHPALRSASVLELIKDLIRPKARPFNTFQVEVTSRCMAKCTYCPHTTKAAQWKSRHMQAHTFVNTWPLLQEVTRVHLQGWGEPLLHPLFFDFVDLARKAGCLVSSTSCGLHLTEGIAKKIIHSGMDVMAFSLAGTDQTSNSPRQGADFDKVYQNIRLLQDMRKKLMGVHLEIHLAYILLADRLEAVKKLPELMQDLQVHASVVSTLDYVADAGQEELSINQHKVEIIAEAKTLLQEAAKKAQANGQHIYYALPSVKPSKECRENIQKSVYMDAEGTIAPCIYLNVPDSEAFKCTFGNVNEESILDIWQKSAFANFRHAHAADTPIMQCQQCVKKFEILT